MPRDSAHDTLVETGASEVAKPRVHAWLIAIGSPEDNFATAGQILQLDGIAEVQFVRNDARDGLAVRRDGDRLEVGVPFGWVSAAHAQLELTEDAEHLGFFIQDLGSRNGTQVADAPVVGRTRVRPGDVIEIGRSFWLIRALGPRKLGSTKPTQLDPTGTASPHLHHLQRTLHRLAQSSLPIVLRGETGTGKEYLAQAIHRVSGRAGPFVVANLGALSDARLEAALFGGKVDGRQMPGLFEQADGGTLLLDELGELSPAVQAKLLLALAEGQGPGGAGHGGGPFDVRLIASCLHDPQALVAQGRFRPDLYARLAGFVAELPPLRSRREDLGLLVRGFIQQQQREGHSTRITTHAFRRLLRGVWPFNVRQLHQTLAAAALLSSGDGTLTADALGVVLDHDDGLPQNPDEVRALRAELMRSLARVGGDPERIAQEMNRSPAQIQRWLERFALEPGAYARVVPRSAEPL